MPIPAPPWSPCPARSRRPGVQEIACGAPLASVLGRRRARAAARGPRRRLPRRLDRGRRDRAVTLDDRPGRHGGSLGAGVIVALGRSACPAQELARDDRLSRRAERRPVRPVQQRPARDRRPARRDGRRARAAGRAAAARALERGPPRPRRLPPARRRRPPPRQRAARLRRRARRPRAQGPCRACRRRPALRSPATPKGVAA